MTSFQFNKIIIVQSLNLDPSLSVYRIGATLKSSIDTTIASLKQSMHSLVCELKEIHSMSDWRDFIDNLHNDCTQGVKPILHFISHGNQGGMALDGVPGGIPWADFMKDMEKVNVATNNNLFVSLCVCYGFYSLLHLLDEHYRIPFCGVVACPYPLRVYTAAKCFPIFYKSLLVNKDIKQASDDLYNELNQIAKVPGLQKDDLIIDFTDNMFMKAVIGDYEKNRKDTASRRKNAIKALKENGENYSNEALIQAFLDQESKMLFKMYRDMRDYKFMLDLAPSEKSRYNMPDDFRSLFENNNRGVNP